MDWGEELEARTPGGSSSSQSRGLVMTLLAVDKSFLYFLSFGDVSLQTNIIGDILAVSSTMGRSSLTGMDS
jgi:hypothetical protein